MNIRIISPAGHCDPDIIYRGAAVLRSWGHDVTLAPHADGRYGRYAGTPAERAADIVEALRDPAVDVLWASRGGYGCIQLLDSLPLGLIAEARKPVVGYSDVTALHALWQRAGVRSVHGPMMRHLADDAETSLLATQALRRLFDAPRPEFMDAEWNAAGGGHPAVVGGNLAVLHALHGTPYDFDYRGCVLFVEDIGESPYKIDRMMQTLRLMGVFGQICGLVVGHFTDCHTDPDMPLSLHDTIRAMTEPYGIPLVWDAPIGHTPDNMPIVEGAPSPFVMPRSAGADC